MENIVLPGYVYWSFERPVHGQSIALHRFYPGEPNQKFLHFPNLINTV